ncbi:MAG: aspartate aminotransferase family protein, partial [Ignavibacteria bacterium]|nr:aspartate aminotransferase family protein [Ignavibacteria bacterium]
LWATLRLFPLNSKNGLYKFLIESRKAAIKFESIICESKNYKLLVSPELDIVNYFPLAKSTSKISRLSQKIFDTLMKRNVKPLYLSLYRMNSNFFCKLNTDIKKDSPETVILRSVLMKPEHKVYVSEIVYELEKTYSFLTQE